MASTLLLLAHLCFLKKKKGLSRAPFFCTSSTTHHHRLSFPHNKRSKHTQNMSAIAQSAISFGACVPSSSSYSHYYSVSFARLLTRLFFFVVVVFGRPRDRVFFMLSSLWSFCGVSVGLRWNKKSDLRDRQTESSFSFTPE